jgi:hypothetical protein
VGQRGTVAGQTGEQLNGWVGGFEPVDQQGLGLVGVGQHGHEGGVLVAQSTIGVGERGA